MREAEHATDRSARAHARFLEYSATGRPDALAEVFDLCAPELLLVAHHLAASGVPAEDLIQQTFLVAMQNADRFDGMRPLMPWLCGILVNIARAANRRSRRSDAVAARPELDRDDPADVAQARELAAETLRAIDDLPARQREVLTLRLVHGLTPTEIAHALREPVGTVKSWIHRGVERLRTLLPAGFAAALVLLVGSDRSLAQAKDVVMAAADARGSELAQPSATTEAAAWASAKPSLGAAAVAALALFFAALWLGARPSTPTAQYRDVEPPARVVHAEAASATDRRDSSVAATAARAPAAPFVAARHADGSPAGIALRLEPQFGAEPSFRDVDLRTDAAGRALVGQLAPGPYRLVPDRGVPRFVDLGSSTQAIEIDLEPGIRVEGRVLDGDGNPLVGARIWLSEHDEVTRGMVATECGTDGRFVLFDVPPRRNLAVMAPGFEATPLRPVVTSEDGRDVRTVTHDFVLDRRCPTFVREVRDANARPCRGALVQLGAGVDAVHRRVVPQHALYPTQILRADEDGIVRADSLPPFPMRVWARSPASAILATIVDASNADSVLTLEAGARWRGDLSVPPDWRVLVEARSEADARRAVDDIAPAFATPRAFVVGAAPIELDGVAPGNVELSARTRLRSAQHEVALRTGDVVAWSPMLEATDEVRGLALDDAGAPLVGYRVVVANDDGPGTPTEVDADGRFRADSTGGCVVWIHGPKGVYPGTLAHRVLAEDREVVFRIARERLPSATMRVRAFDVDGTHCNGVRVLSAADATQIPGRRDADGWTSFGLLPAGPYFVAVLDESGTRLVHGPITLAPGETRDVDALRIAQPGRVRVRLADRESRPLDGRVLLTTLDAAFVVTVFDVVSGEGLSPPVPPGAYQLVAERAFGAPALRVDVASDVTTAATWITEATVPVALQFASPELCGGLRLHVRWVRERDAAGDSRTWTEVVKIPDGMVGDINIGARTLPGSYRIDVRSCEGLVGSARFDVVSGSQRTQVVIPLRGGE
jgi:RNA polymerase sigma-70 factor (ECF subfamily)